MEETILGIMAAFAVIAACIILGFAIKHTKAKDKKWAAVFWISFAGVAVACALCLILCKIGLPVGSGKSTLLILGIILLSTLIISVPAFVNDCQESALKRVSKGTVEENQLTGFSKAGIMISGYAQLKLDMPESEVMELFGKPTGVRRNGDIILHTAGKIRNLRV